MRSAERGEHLDVLLEERGRLLDAPLDAVGDVETGFGVPMMANYSGGVRECPTLCQ
jgi:hypothetical protein